ncbi:hypothetical protein MMC17_006462 [Xylographa soralifera]|nr:hypothetical protein [Xylographa soralifera]
MSELVLLDAWNMIPRLCDYLNKPFENHFTVEELVLDAEAIWPLNGYNDIVGSRRWGSRIKRLRIEHVTLSQIELDRLSTLAWARLRVLMLDSLRTLPLTRSREQFQSMAVFPESHMAMEAALKHVADLRVVVISAFQFWIHRASTSVVTYLAEAHSYPIAQKWKAG